MFTPDCKSALRFPFHSFSNFSRGDYMTLRPRFGLPFAFAAIAALLLSVVPAFGQETAGGLQGFVTIKSDKSPLPGVSVEAVHVPTGTRYTTVTAANGRFVILNVRVGGPYTVSARIGGFKTETGAQCHVITSAEI